MDRTVRVDFPYVAMNAIMRVVKEQQPRIEEQTFDNLCTMRLAIRESRAAGLIEKLRKAGGKRETEETRARSGGAVKASAGEGRQLAVCRAATAFTARVFAP